MSNKTLDSFYLDTIHDTKDSTFWMTDVKVNNISVTFKVDTGGEVTAISESTLQTLGQLEVSMPDKKLCEPNGAPLDLREASQYLFLRSSTNVTRKYLWSNR